MTSLVDVERGAELLWSRPGVLPSALGPTGEPSRAYFDENVFVGGWFTMFPTAGGPGSDPELRLHGDAPRVPWDVIHAGRSELVAGTQLSDGRFRLERTIRLIGPVVGVGTRAWNDGPDIASVAFGEHPCVALSALGIASVRIGSVERSIEHDDAVVHEVSRAEDAEMRADGIARRLLLRWDGTILPGALLWRRGTEIIAIEPKSFVGRSADEVGDDRRTIQPGCSIEWSMSLRVE
jgi:hypothetical protein